MTIIYKNKLMVFTITPTYVFETKPNTEEKIRVLKDESYCHNVIDGEKDEIPTWNTSGIIYNQ